MASEKFIPVCEPSINDEDRTALIEAFDSGWISSGGEYNEKLENEFSNYCGVKYGVSVSNGTVAIHLALRALDLKEGDEVILPNFNGIYGVFALLYEKIKPVFVDAEADFWTIDTSKIEEKITDKTRAILLTHLYGHPCNMAPIRELCQKYNLNIIEDSAEAHGAKYLDRPVGSLSDVSTYSFFANKIISSGEGGMAITNNPEIADKLKYFRNQCFPLNGDRNFIHEDLGYNYRLTNIQAALAYSQFKRIKELIELRISIKKKYIHRLSDIESIKFQAEAPWATSVNWMTCILVDYDSVPTRRDKLESYLLEKKIQTRRLFVGMDKQPVLKKYNFQTQERFPITDKLSESGLYIPTSSHMSDETIDRICGEIRKFFKIS